MGTGSGIQALTAIQKPDVLNVLAVDSNEKAVLALKQKIQKEKLRKITVLQSDLFENVFGKFNLIIFNPPYLPKDKGIEDPALYGGKKGWELSARFFDHVSNYLAHDGTILFLFSSLTNKAKIDEIIQSHLFQFNELDRQKIPFEELYVYEITKTPLLRELEGKGLEDIHYFAQGKRGKVFTGIMDRSKLVKTHFPSKKDIVRVAIKIHKKSTAAEGRIANEAAWLEKLNKKKIGPRLLFSGPEYIVSAFVEGTFIVDWITSHTKEEIQPVLAEVFRQCFVLDLLSVNKEEMHHPLKHIIIDASNNPTLIDFERCYETEKPHNVTQFADFLGKYRSLLVKKGFTFTVKELRDAAAEYKETYREKEFGKILELMR